MNLVVFIWDSLPIPIPNICYMFKCLCSSFLFFKVITKEETEAISASSTQLLSSALRDLEAQTAHPSPLTSSGANPCPGSSRGAQYEVDVASFLWSESPGDLLSDAGWVSVTQRGQQQQRSGLAMKTQALTPCVQNFCSSMDAKLKARLDDLQHYLPAQDKGMAASDHGPFQFSVWAVWTTNLTSWIMSHHTVLSHPGLNHQLYIGAQCWKCVGHDKIVSKSDFV